MKNHLKSFIVWLYAAVHVEKDIPHDYKSHVFVLRVSGVWPMAEDSCCFKCLTIVFLILVAVIFPLSLPMNILLVDFKIQIAMQYSFAALSALAATIKIAVIYWRRNDIRAFFRAHTTMSRDGNTAAHNHVVRMNIQIHALFTCLYILWDIFAQINSWMAPPEDKTISSTMNLPYDFAQSYTIYVIVLVFQIVSSVLMCVLVALADAIFIAKMNTVCGHLMQLKERLRNLGDNYADDDRFYRDLIDCCQRYEDCLR